MILFVIFGLTIIKIPYEVKKDYQKMEFYYSSDGKDWDVIGVYQYPYLSSSIKDTFRWYVKGNPKGDIRIKVVYASPQGSLEKEGEDFKMEVKDEKGGDYFYYGGNKGFDKSDTTYSWRMLGYDAQHTGYYPHPLYPPLKFKWKFSGIDGHDFDMVEPAAAYGMLYVGDGGSNWILAIDIETGNVVWKKELTANVCGATLCPGDSILFVGTWMSWDTLQPTFFALDPLTGAEKWARAFRNSVGHSPVCVDSFVFISGPNNHTLYAWNLKGDLLWKRRGVTDLPPSYWDGRIYGGGEPPVSNPRLWCLDAFTGDSIWTSSTVGNGPEWQSIYQNKIFFFATDTLFALDVENGNMMWKRTGFSTYLNLPVRHSYGISYVTDGIYIRDTVFTDVKAFETFSGKALWKVYLEPVDTNGGWSNMGISTKDSIIWIPNRDYIYSLKSSDASIINREVLPYSSQTQGSWGFPIAYKNYFIGAHRSFIYCYEGDTVPSEDTTYDFIFSGYQEAGTNRLRFYVSIPEGKEVIIKMYDVSGRLRGSVYNGYLDKGEHWLSWDVQGLPTGLYFAYLKAEYYEKSVKIIFLRRR